MADVSKLFEKAEDATKRRSFDMAIDLYQQILVIDADSEKARLALREQRKNQSLAIENKRRQAKGLPPLDDIDDEREDQDGEEFSHYCLGGGCEIAANPFCRRFPRSRERSHRALQILVTDEPDAEFSHQRPHPRADQRLKLVPKLVE